MHLQPIHLTLSKPTEKLTAAASRFWGNPALPRGAVYPMYIDADGDEYPYFFVGQINLADIASYDKGNLLPHKGLLSFFAKIDHYMGYYDAPMEITGYISDADAVKVLYFPDTADMTEVVLLDDDDQETSPGELMINFSHEAEPLGEENALFASPTHREWENWEHPFEDWLILLQVDSYDGEDFNLNFMDFGVLDFLISPKALKAGDFSNIRAIVLST